MVEITEANAREAAGAAERLLNDPWLKETLDELVIANTQAAIQETDAEKPLAMVFDLDEVTVAGGLCDPEDGTLINPRMPRRNAVGFSGFE